MKAANLKLVLASTEQPAEPAPEAGPGTATVADSSFQVGDQVRVVGLQAKPELNGLEGKIVQWDANESRWRVRLQDGTGKMLKSLNLQVVAATQMASVSLPSAFAAPPPAAGDSTQFTPGQRVRIAHLQARPELNGLEGTIVQWDVAEERWRIRMDDGTGKMLRAANLEAASAASNPPVTGANLTIGQSVRVTGLQARPELNGLEGTLVDWDASEMRWKIRMTDGTGKMLRPVNLQLIPSPSADAAGTSASAVATGEIPNEAEATFEPGQIIRVVGLKMRPEMNGAVGTIFGWDPSQSLWKVRMTDGAGKMLQSSNMELVNAAAETNPGDDTAYSIGQSVRVVGLKARADLNGLEGTIVEWDKGQNRWKVKMTDGTGKLFKTANLELTSGTPSPPAAAPSISANAAAAPTQQPDGPFTRGQAFTV